jgi:hypothetical protein
MKNLLKIDRELQRHIMRGWKSKNPNPRGEVDFNAVKSIPVIRKKPKKCVTAKSKRLEISTYAESH